MIYMIKIIYLSDVENRSILDLFAQLSNARPLELFLFKNNYYEISVLLQTNCNNKLS